MLSIIGFLILIAVMYFVLSGKIVPAIAFVVFPLIGAALAGFGIEEVAEFIKTGVGTTWATAVLFIFSIIFFGIMSDAGIFDKPVAWLTGKAKNSIVMIYIVTAIIAMIGHMDGASVTTYIITLTAMLPIYRRLGLNVLNLLLITGLATGVMNLVPWGGPTIRAATAIGIDANDLWLRLIPMQIFGIVITLGAAIYLGMREQKKGTTAQVNHDHVEDNEILNPDSPEENIYRNPKKDPINWILTIGVIALLVWNKFPTYSVFMVGALVALWYNFPSVKVQQKRLESYAPNIIGLVTTLLGAGIFLGVLSGSGMINAMASTLISVVPDGFKQYLHIVVGALGAPIGMTMGPDPYFYGVLPLISEVVNPLGVSPIQVASAMLIGENVALSVSPCVPTTFLLIGMANVELKDHIRHSFIPMWGVSLLMLAFAVMTSVV